VATLSITVPDALVPRVLAAMRATYPSETGDARDAAGNLVGTPLADGPAAKAVLRQFVINMVSRYEETQVRAQQANQATVAGQQAATAMAVIT
jgi:hypothetical protein